MTPIALDITIGVIIFLSTLISYFRGIVKEFFTLAGLGLAVYVSYKGGHLLVPSLNKLLNVPPEGSTEAVVPLLGILKPAQAALVAAYGGTFLVIFLLMILLGYLITHWIKQAGLGVVDRLLGAGFGFARGFLLVFLLYVPCTYLIDQQKFPDWAKNSFSVPILQQTLAWANTHLELDKMIEDHGGSIAIKLDKVDPNKLGADADAAGKELKDEVKKEETEIQKAVPETPPAPVPDLTPPPQSSPQVVSPPPSEPAPVMPTPAQPSPAPAPQPEPVPPQPAPQTNGSPPPSGATPNAP